MSSLVLNLFNPENEKVVELAYRVQKKVYGVYVPPTLKQVITLKELLISTGIRKDFKPDELLGLSRIECKLLIDELKKLEN